MANHGADGGSNTDLNQGGRTQGADEARPGQAPVQTEESGAGYGNNAGEQGPGSEERPDETKD